MKLSHALATAALLAVPLSCLAANAPESAPPSELRLVGGWQAVSVTVHGLGGRETVEPKRNDLILEFLFDHTLRLHFPCGPKREQLKAKGDSLFMTGSWELGKDGRLRLQAKIGDSGLDEGIPVRMVGDRMQFVNATGKLDEFVRYTSPLPVQCE